VWNKTKKGALAAGGFTMDLLMKLATSFLKKEIEDSTGIKLLIRSQVIRYFA
jgi:hypothetical protein